MRTSFLIFFIILLFQNSLSGQNSVVFNKSIEFNPDIQHEGASTVLSLEDGSCLIIGKTSNRYTGADSICIVKVDNWGNSLWIKKHDVNINGAEVARAATLLNNGDFIIAGAILQSFNQDAFLLKLTSEGDIIWYKEYGNEYYQSISDIISTSDGGFLFCRRTDDPSMFGNGEKETIGWVVKTDSLGKMEWQNGIGTEWWSSGRNVYEKDSFFVLINKETLEDDMTGHIYIYQVNKEDGTVLNQQKYLEPDRHGVNRTITTQDNGYLLMGLKPPIPFGSSFFNGAVHKIDSTGILSWTLLIDEEATSQEWLVDGKQLLDGNFLITGYAYSDMEATPSWRGWLVKVSEEGELLWSKIMRHDEDNIDEYLYDIDLTIDNGAILTGTTRQIPEPGMLGLLRNNIWIVKVDTAGNDYLPPSGLVSATDTFFCIPDTIPITGIPINGEWCDYSDGVDNCGERTVWWTGSGAAYLDDSTSTHPNFIPQTSGFLDLYLNTIDEEGTVGISPPINFVVLSEILIENFNDTSIYVGDTLLIAPEIIGQSNTSLEWMGSAVSYLLDSTLNDPIFVAQDSGVFNLQFSIANGIDCIQTENIQITVIDTSHLDTMIIDALGDVEQLRIKVSPNPFNNHIIVEQESNGNQLSLKLFDISGRLILETKEKTIQTTQLPIGIYFYQLSDKNKKVLGSGKLVKQ